jgi:hypothetical protein
MYDDDTNIADFSIIIKADDVDDDLTPWVNEDARALAHFVSSRIRLLAEIHRNLPELSPAGRVAVADAVLRDVATAVRRFES